MTKTDMFVELLERAIDMLAHGTTESQCVLNTAARQMASSLLYVEWEEVLEVENGLCGEAYWSSPERTDTNARLTRLLVVRDYYRAMRS
jgi:hypothetical protein